MDPIDRPISDISQMAFGPSSSGLSTRKINRVGSATSERSAITVGWSRRQKTISGLSTKSTCNRNKLSPIGQHHSCVTMTTHKNATTLSLQQQQQHHYREAAVTQCHHRRLNAAAYYYYYYHYYYFHNSVLQTCPTRMLATSHCFGSFFVNRLFGCTKSHTVLLATRSVTRYHGFSLSMSSPCRSEDV